MLTEYPKKPGSRWSRTDDTPNDRACAAELASGRLTAAPLTDPRITRTIVVALPTNRSAGQHVLRTAELVVRGARNAVRRREWLEASWIAE